MGTPRMRRRRRLLDTCIRVEPAERGFPSRSDGDDCGQCSEVREVDLARVRSREEADEQA